MENKNELEHFNKMAVEKGYAWWGSKTYSGQIRKKRRAQIAKKFVGDLDNKIILEIGCACGDYTKYIYKEFGSKNKIVASDLSPEQIKLAIIHNKDIKAEFLVDNCEKMKFEDNSIDCIIANSILHHVDIDKCLNECCRVLKNGGQIFFTEPNMLNPQVFLEKNVMFIKKLAGHSENEKAFYRWDVAKKLAEHGFQNNVVKNFDFLHPATPKILANFLNFISGYLEKIPLVKEISGSLIIYGRKKI
ncbi:MAG: class I SAM-dependent methyltransferase [bacterium]